MNSGYGTDLRGCFDRYFCHTDFTDYTDVFNDNENDNENENHKNTFVQVETASLMPRLYAFPC